MCCVARCSPAFHWTGNCGGTPECLKPFPASWAGCLQRRAGAGGEIMQKETRQSLSVGSCCLLVGPN